MNQNKSLDSLLQQGHHQLERGQYEAGLEVFQQADNLFPNNPQVKYGLGLAYFRLEQYQESIEHLNLALQLQPVYPLAQIRRGMAYKALEQSDQANADFEKVLEIEPQTHEDWRARGIAFDELKQPESALECYDKALEIESNGHQSLLNKGLTLNSLNRYEEASICFEEATQIAPENFLVWENYGNALMLLQSYQSAICNYNIALQIKPYNYSVLYSKGFCLASIGSYQEAIDSYQQALSINTGNFVAWYFKGLAHSSLQQYTQELDCYNRALEINPDHLLSKNQQKIWADNQINLGKDYRDSTSGNQKKNLSNAIKYFTAALKVYTEDSYTEKWCVIKNHLGSIYCDFLELSKYKNFEIAINHFTDILRVHTKNSSPLLWAITHYNLGNCYGKRGNEHKQENIEIAIDSYHKALEIYTKLDLLSDCAKVNYALGIIYSYSINTQRCPKKNRKSNLELAVQHLKSALKIYNKINFPQQWASVQYLIGNAYLKAENAEIEENRENNIELSLNYHHNALIIFTKADFPQRWVAIQYNLAVIYQKRIKGDKADNLEMSIDCCHNVLNIYTKSSFPDEWAGTQNVLAAAYQERIKGKRADNLEKAILLYRNALSIFTQSNFPMYWAEIQCNLANVYQDRILADKADNLEMSIECCHNALNIYTKSSSPYEWALSQNSLGSAYSYRIKGKRADNLELAIKYYLNALVVRTQADFPFEWAGMQHNLATAYSQRVEGEKADNVEQAIKYFCSALIVHTQNQFPYKWATTQKNLANAYTDRIKGDKSRNLEKAIECSLNALVIYTKNDIPFEWAIIQKNLGYVYSKKITGNPQENIDRAIECYKAALTFLTPETDPIECLKTSRSYGDLASGQKQWKLAIDAYATAIEAVEISRQSASNEARKQEILSDAISVYVNMARACIQDGQYVRAIEYLERSKTRNLVDLLTERQMYPKGEFPQHIIDSLDALRRNLIAAERRLQQQKTEECFNRLASLRQSMEYLLRTHIQPVDPSFQLSQRVEPISFAQIQAALPTPQTALIEWCVSKDTFTTFIVTKDRTQPLVITKDFEEVQTLTEIKDKYLSKYRKYKDKWQERLILFLYQLARTLEWDEVIESLKQVLPDCNKIILVPHRWLHIIPIHALPIKDGRCLLDLFPQGVSYAPSVQLLELTQKEVLEDTGDKECREDKKFFAVQNPTEDPALPYTNVEVAAIRKQFQPHDDVLVGKEGHRQALTIERLSKANYTHFSCHGTFNFEKPERSALLLADSMVEEAQEDKGEKEDRGARSRYLPSRDGSYIDLEKCLTLGEIFSLDLRNCRLVTLSACETGLTDIKNLSDEYIGLPSGFLYAGSPSVVSSLWAVSDLSTTFLMIKFYQNLQTTDSVAIALNQAQLWLRGVTKEELMQWKTTLDIPGDQKFRIDSALRSMPDNSYPFAAPSHWAAFCAVGS